MSLVRAGGALNLMPRRSPTHQTLSLLWKVCSDPTSYTKTFLLPSGSNKLRHVLSFLHCTRQRKALRARVENHSVSTRVNATKRAHGEPVAFLAADWTSLIREIKVQRGKVGTPSSESLRGIRTRPPRRHSGSRDVGTRGDFVRREKAKSFTSRASEADWGAS